MPIYRIDQEVPQAIDGGCASASASPASLVIVVRVNKGGEVAYARERVAALNLDLYLFTTSY